MTVQNIAMQLVSEGELAKQTATQVKNKILEKLEPSETAGSFFTYFVNFGNTRESESTREKYAITAKRLLEYDKSIKTLPFESINKNWLTGFDRFLKKYNPSKNGRNIHFRNIRAAFNDAIDNEVTEKYPFRKFKIQPEPTIKRALTLKQLRELFNYEVEPYQQRYLDMFKLSFFLIGINVTDLCLLQDITPDERVVYTRAKTRAKFSIKVEPEAKEIIERYRGKNYLLNLMDNIRDTRIFTKKFDRGLKEIGVTTFEPNPEWRPNNKKHKYKVKHHSAFPHLSSYWARHTWATIAAELDIPDDTISRALGHSQTSGAKVTQVYINFNNRKIDEANRRVIDYVLYNRK